MEWYAWNRALRGLFWVTGEYDGVEMFSMFLRTRRMITCVCRGRGRWRGEAVVGEMVAYGFEVDP